MSVHLFDRTSHLLGERGSYPCPTLSVQGSSRRRPLTLTPRPQPVQRLQKWLDQTKVTPGNQHWPLLMKMDRKTATANGYNTTDVFIESDGSVHLGTANGVVIGKLACLTKAS